MAIKSNAQIKARTIDGKPVGDFFNETAQRQKTDNRYATYDAPKIAEPASVAKRLAKPSAQEVGKGMGMSAIAAARNEGIKASRKKRRVKPST